MEEIIDEIEELKELKELKYIIDENVDLQNMSKADHEQIAFYIRSSFSFFIFLWALIILGNELHTKISFFVLIIPFALFSIGFMNAYEIADDGVENDVFTTTFITAGLILSMPLLGLFNKDLDKMKEAGKSTSEICHIETSSKFLSRVIFLAMIFTLFSYYHIWVDKFHRHVVKIIRSCLEQIAVTLYIYALVLFFLK